MHRERCFESSDETDDYVIDYVHYSLDYNYFQQIN